MIRLLVILISITYSSFSFSESNSPDPGFLNSKSQLLGSLVEVHFSGLVSESDLKSLQQLFDVLPQELLQVKIDPDADEFYIDSHKRSERDYSIRTDALHILLHRYDNQTGMSRSKKWRKLSGWKREWLGLILAVNNQDARAYAESKGMRNPSVLSVSATLDEQEFGSISNIAMQRSSYVKLASAQMTLASDSWQRGDIQIWRFTALEVRKFKDRLDRVPQYFSFGGGIGLGLSLLEFEKNLPLGIQHTNWLGGELLFNLFSSAHNDNYVYVSVGADIRRHKKADIHQDGLAIPVRLESLLTFGENRRWQWRN